MSRAPLTRSTIVTAETVYGNILVSGMIVATGRNGESSWAVFLSVLGAVIVFWAAHVYAGTVAAHGVSDDGDETTLREAFRRSLHRSVGLLLAALIPLVILLLGALRVIEDAAALWGALWFGVIILAVIGYSAFEMRGSSIPMRIVGSLTTAAFGLAMVALKAVIH